MNNITKAIAAAREALAKRDELAHRGNRLRAEERANWECAQHLRDLLAALDAAEPEGLVMVQRADLAALEATDFGRCGWSVRADLAARRLRDGLLAAANHDGNVRIEE